MSFLVITDVCVKKIRKKHPLYPRRGLFNLTLYEIVQSGISQPIFGVKS